MKRLLLSLVIVLGISITSLSAQEGKKGSMRGVDSKELNLTQDQKTKMEKIHSDFKAKHEELRNKTDLSKENKDAELKKLRDQHHSAVKEILTPEQQAKMSEWMEKGKDRGLRRGDWGMKRDDRRPGKPDMANKGRDNKSPRPDMNKGKFDNDRRPNMIKDLNLTEEQSQKIKTLREEHRQKAKELADKQREEINKILTPEQQAKVKESREKGNQSNMRPMMHGKRNMGFKMDEASREKMKELRENFQKEKKAIELSKIAPDAQKQKITALQEKYKKERQEIMKAGKKQESKALN